MNSPKTPQQLSDAIESLVTSYIDDVRRAAQGAVDRSLSGTRRPVKREDRSSSETSRPTKRRSDDELVVLCDRLYELVRARPGESMAAFAAETGVAARALHRPMLRLKAMGRIRSVGERNMTRYFPAIERPSKTVDA